MGPAHPDSPLALTEKEHPGTENIRTAKELWKVCSFSPQSSHQLVKIVSYKTV